MKKTFKLHIEGKNSDRLLDSIKHELRKYVKRERSKALPNGKDHIVFKCKLGASEENALELHVGEIAKKIDAVAASGADSFYVEIIGAHLARPADEHGAAQK